MPRPRFSEALLERRRELGLSIGQASRILKLREDVLVAFEEGDYEHMPQSGYAQGMLSSYARYLGLNAREIVDLFQEELYEHRHGTSSHELRRRTRQTQAGRGVSGYDLVNEAGSRPKAYVEYRPLLPSSGGPAGDMGYFATTSPARSTSSVPLGGAAPIVPASRGSYSSQGARPFDAAPQGRHPYNQAPARERAQGSTARRRAAGSRRRSGARAPEDVVERSRYRRDDVSTRRVRPSEYTDDMRLDDRANPYAPASTISGRRSSRNIASIERPNVRRRGSSGPRRGTSGRGSRRPPARGGVMGVVEEFFSSPRRALFAIIVLCAAALTAIVVLSVGSCVSGRAQGGRNEGQTVAVNSATQDGSGTGSAADDAGADDADSPEGEASDSEEEPQPTEDAEADASGDAESPEEGEEGSAAKEPKETIVEVSVANGGYSWVEVLCDGVSEVAEGVTGPWSQTYNVHDSITVQVADTSVVTVTENGEPADFTSHAGGVASVTIKGTPLPEPAEGEAADGADGQSAGDASSAETDQTYY